MPTCTYITGTNSMHTYIAGYTKSPNCHHLMPLPHRCNWNRVRNTSSITEQFQLCGIFKYEMSRKIDSFFKCFSFWWTWYSAWEHITFTYTVNPHLADMSKTCSMLIRAASKRTCACGNWFIGNMLCDTVQDPDSRNAVAAGPCTATCDEAQMRRRYNMHVLVQTHITYNNSHREAVARMERAAKHCRRLYKRNVSKRFDRIMFHTIFVRPLLRSMCKTNDLVEAAIWSVCSSIFK